jgi:hypothetical protein
MKKASAGAEALILWRRLPAGCREDVPLSHSIRYFTFKKMIARV